ncbi:MAG: LON peptidase substrate-binding domain-containing protein [Gemmatimonadales bacterium]|nr:LON peptidase substrate-binding domain-containing protein [Gemmatimonadales bacterium]
MAHRLPLFPLGLVLFPGVPLPLHIFEPRYRQLLADCQAGDGRFGILAATEAGPPVPGAVGCIAAIRGVQPLADGRSNVVVTGERRFLLTRYLDEGTPYYLGMVEEFDDEPGTEPSSAAAADLRDHARAYADLLGRLGDREAEPLELEADPEALSFQVASLLEVDLAIKQQLLAVRDTAERAERLLALLPRLTAALREAVAVHEGARTNGKGGHHPDIVLGP